jgi:hypothetical protein
MILLTISDRDEILPKVFPVLSFPGIVPLVGRYMIRFSVTQQFLQVFRVGIQEGASVHCGINQNSTRLTNKPAA